jgi:hypothetical protein
MGRARWFAVALVVASVAILVPGGVKRAAAAEQAREQITELFDALFDGRGWTEDKEELLADEELLGPLMRRIKKDYGDRMRTKPGRVEIEHLFFASPTEAFLELHGLGLVNWSGFTAEVVDGRWRLGIGTACELAGYGIRTAKPRCFENLSAREALEREQPQPTTVSWLGSHPDDPWRAVDLVSSTIQSLFAPGEPAQERAEFVEGSARMARVIQDAGQIWEMDKSPAGPGFHWVDSVVFTSATTADVAYRWVRRDPMSVRSAPRQIRHPIARRPTLSVAVENGHWKVTRKTFCSLHWAIEHWCPDGEPVPPPKELPAATVTEKDGFPKDVPPFAVIDDAGSLWVVRDGVPERWSDAGPEGWSNAGPEPGRRAYMRARFGPDGSLYALPYVGKRMQIDRFTGPGRRTTVIDEPAFGSTYDEPGKVGDVGYSDTFAVSDLGIALVRVEKIAGDDCYDEDGNGCEPADGWFVELRPFSRLDRVGRSDPQPFTSRPFDAMWFVGVDIDDESSDGRTMLVTSYPNKPWIDEEVVRLPSFRSAECCEKSSRGHGQNAVMSPTGAEMLFKRERDEPFPHGREVTPELHAVGVEGKSERVILRWSRFSGGQLADVWDWTDGFVAYTYGSEPYELYLLRLSDNTTFETGFTFGGIKGFDFVMD